MNCVSCGDPATHKCGACKVATYCSEECQRSDWSTLHNRICINIENPDHHKVRQLLEVVRPGEMVHMYPMEDIAEMIQLEYPIDNAVSDKLKEWRQRYRDWKLRKKGKKQMARGQEMYDRGSQRY